MTNNGKITCAVRVVTSTAYRDLEMLHHRKVTSYSGSFWLHIYYTGNGLSPHWKVIVERLQALISSAVFNFGMIHA